MVHNVDAGAPPGSPPRRFPPLPFTQSGRERKERRGEARAWKGMRASRGAGALHLARASPLAVQTNKQTERTVSLKRAQAEVGASSQVKRGRAPAGGAALLTDGPEGGKGRGAASLTTTTHSSPHFPRRDLPSCNCESSCRRVLSRRKGRRRRVGAEARPAAPPRRFPPHSPPQNGKRGRGEGARGGGQGRDAGQPGRPRSPTSGGPPGCLRCFSPHGPFLKGRPVEKDARQAAEQVLQQRWRVRRGPADCAALPRHRPSAPEKGKGARRGRC